MPSGKIRSESAFSSFRRSRLWLRRTVAMLLFFNGLLLGASGLLLPLSSSRASGVPGREQFRSLFDLGGTIYLGPGGSTWPAGPEDSIAAIRAYHRGLRGGIFGFRVARSAALRKSHSTLKQTAVARSPWSIFPLVPFIGSRRCHRLLWLYGGQLPPSPRFCLVILARELSFSLCLRRVRWVSREASWGWRKR